MAGSVRPNSFKVYVPFSDGVTLILILWPLKFSTSTYWSKLRVDIFLDNLATTKKYEEGYWMVRSSFLENVTTPSGWDMGFRFQTYICEKPFSRLLNVSSDRGFGSSCQGWLLDISLSMYGKCVTMKWLGFVKKWKSEKFLMKAPRSSMDPAPQVHSTNCQFPWIYTAFHACSGVSLVVKTLSGS